MSKEGDKAAVFQTTKVRTKLKGDCSWMQRSSDSKPEAQEEKPWIAEVRASRVNGAPIESSPTPSPTKAAPPPPVKPDTERAPTSGYLIRGVFTKLDDKSAASSTANGFSGSTHFNKKPSESYKRIAPHTVKPTSENQDPQLSNEEQEKRTEAASSVLKNSTVRQRSYVLSAAKKFESKASDDSPTSFVAKRVEIDDDDDSTLLSAPVSSPLPAPVTPVASAPRPKPRRPSEKKISVNVAVEEPPKVPEAVPDLVTEVEPVPAPVTAKDPFEEMKPGCTKVATPLPELIPIFVESVHTEPEPLGPDVTVHAPAPTTAELPSSVSCVTEITVITQTHQEPKTKPELTREPEPELEKEPEINPEPELEIIPEPATIPAPEPETVLIPEPLIIPAPEPEPVLIPKPLIIPAPEPEPVLIPEPLIIPAPEPEPVLIPKPLIIPAPEPEPVLIPEPVIQIEPAQELSIILEAAQGLQPDPEPEPVPKPVTYLEPEPEPEPDLEHLQTSSSKVETLVALYDTLIPFNTTSTSDKDGEPELEQEERGSADVRVLEISDTKAPVPVLSSCEVLTDDLLALDDGPEESAQPVPSSPGRWSQDLLGGLDSEAEPAKTSVSLDFLADDVIPINTEARSLSTVQVEEKPTDETQSTTETITITTRTVIITDNSAEENNADPWSSHVTTTIAGSSADPFDPYPIGTTSSNSSSDLLQPLTDLPINSAPTTLMENNDPNPETNMSGNALESLADDVIPIDTDTTSLSSRRSWAHTWEMVTPQPAETEESQDPEPEGQAAADQQTVIMFERKSTENDSPWDKWTSPTIYTVTTEDEEEEEEEKSDESPEDTHVQTVTTVTVREIESEPESAMDRYGTYSRTVVEEAPRVETPEPEKKGIVYVKEYVNAPEHSVRDPYYRGSDYLTSSSTTYSYSSPSAYTRDSDYRTSSSTTYGSPSSSYSRDSMSTTCTYCGEQVGNDAKITIEHLNIHCHPACFKCAVCCKPMGDLLYSMYLHGGKVHCDSCYSRI